MSDDKIRITINSVVPESPESAEVIASSPPPCPHCMQDSLEMIPETPNLRSGWRCLACGWSAPVPGRLEKLTVFEFQAGLPGPHGIDGICGGGYPSPSQHEELLARGTLAELQATREKLAAAERRIADLEAELEERRQSALERSERE